jgi:hypothetical protein
LASAEALPEYAVPSTRVHGWQGKRYAKSRLLPRARGRYTGLCTKMAQWIRARENYALSAGSKRKVRGEVHSQPAVNKNGTMDTHTRVSYAQ